MRRARIAAVVLCGVVAALGFAATPAAADGLSATLGVATASVGEKVRVTGTGWPAQELVQLVTCGELALNGSSSCDMRSALATMTSAEGTFTVDLQVGKPPKPCPCVVHIALVGVGSQGQVDVPFTVRGHPVATPPRAPSTPAEVEVVDVRLDGGSAWTEWFGGPAHRTLVYTVRNSGSQPLPNPMLRVRVGKADGGDTVSVPPPGAIAAGETRTFRVPVSFPFAAFGHYEVRADLSGLGAAVVAHEAYPWGLVALNVIGLALIVTGIVRRLRAARRRPAIAAAKLPPAEEFLLSSVVRVPALRAYLVFDDAPGARRLRRRAASRISAHRLRALLGDPELAESKAAAASTIILPRITDDADLDTTAVIDIRALATVLATRYPHGPALSERDPAYVGRPPKREEQS